ncbi:protein kinase family protein [Propionimicrobium sp. PCR01-08-3]|uniref:protein kinase family protein n=1 Tax=Propionimicrobium sp. PCR01-08-3 TaxID=3052086 RepID=UPI00255C3341|nr:protein kinase family protein [Propionimicrobium sp. PCR01-08-3]WIY82604.1 protein kinase family protein [Propionimicrobium sp. PCR01-08-3]
MSEYSSTDPTGRSARPEAAPGLILGGRYRLEALLAHSGGIMSWRATDHVLSRPVLMHLLSPDDDRMGWVLNAARRASTITDARYLRVLDALEASGQEPWSFVVSEYAVGDSLQALLQHGPLSDDQASYVAGQMAGALAPLHARGMFHLRINPASVIITVSGQIKIVGFLINAALRPKPGEDRLAWTDQEAIDCYDLGRVLYALTTATWPIPPDEPQGSHWGLASAPLRLNPTDEHGAEQLWASPHEVNPAISPSLSTVTLAALRPRLGLVGQGLHTAHDIEDSLEGLCDLVDAEESLENLMREVHHLGTPSATPVQTERVLGASADDAATQQMSAVDAGFDDPSERPTQVVPQSQPWQPAPEDDWAPTMEQPAVDDDFADDSTTTHSADDYYGRPQSTGSSGYSGASGYPGGDDYSDQPGYLAEAASAGRPGPSAQQGRSQHQAPVAAPPRVRSRKASSSAFGRRWIVFLVVFILLALVVLQIRGCAGNGGGESGDGTSETAAAGPVAIASAFDFDPTADGGDNNENSDQASLAADGDPDTAWHTLTYLNNPAFGGLKPGAGIVYDLGEAQTVQSVRVLLDNEPAAVQLMVPIENDASAASPPMNTVSEWQVIAAVGDGGAETTLTPEEEVSTRWVMVYFTSLPGIGGNQYRSGVAETYINQ